MSRTTNATYGRKVLNRFGSALLLALTLVVTGQPAGAVPVFDITATSGTGSGQTAAGTSNGVGWVLSPTFIDTAVTDGTYIGFNTANFVPPVPASDMIHGPTGESFTLTFDEVVGSILFYLKENNAYGSRLDFGLPAVVVSGDVQIFPDGVSAGTWGGVVRFDNVNSLTMTHTFRVFDGMDMAWFVQAVPAPPSLALYAAGVAGVTLWSYFRRRRRMTAP